MKKYTIKDSLGNEKTVYAENVDHAIRLLNDSKTTDMGQHVPSHQTYNPEYSVQQFKSYIHNIIKDLYGNDYNRETVRAISKLNTYASQVIDDFKADIKNSDLDKRKTVQYYTQYVDALYEEIADVKNIQNIDGQSLKKIDDIHAEMAHSIHDSIHDEDNFFYYDADEDRRSLDDYKHIMQQCGLTITKIKGNSREAYIYYKGSSSAEQKAADKLGISLDDSVKDSKIADIEPISHYIEAWRISNLAADLFYEAEKYGYSFDYVLKEYDSMTQKILNFVKRRINDERNNMINWKQNHPDKLK